MNDPKNDPLPCGIYSTDTANISAPAPEIYEKCITCKDLGFSCKGPKLNSLITIANVREYHRRLRTYRKFTLHQIYVLVASEISEGCVRDYFGRDERDFRWTAVALIDNALVALCGNGTIPTVPLCPATASSFQDQLSVEIQLRVQAEEQAASLQTQMAELADKHMDQMEAFRKSQMDRVAWLRSDIRLWRIIAFCLLGAFCISLLF